MDLNATARASLEPHINRISEKKDATLIHVLKEATFSPARATQQQEEENNQQTEKQSTENCTDLGDTNELGADSKIGTSALFVQALRDVLKPIYGSGGRHGGGVAKVEYKDPNVIIASIGSRLTPIPFTGVDRKQDVVLDSLKKNESETAIVTTSSTDVDSTIPSDSIGLGVGLGGEKVICHTRLTSSSYCGPVIAKTTVAKDNNSGNADDVSLKPEDNAVTVVKETNNKEYQQEDNSAAAVAQEEQKQKQQQQQQQQGQQRHCISSRTEHRTNSVHNVRGARSFPTTTAATIPSNCARPVLALSVHLVAFYKRVNEAYCWKRRLEAPGPKYNNGFDDSEGHYLVLFGEEILNRYTVQEVLGKGSFGTVLRCYDEKRRENVALKITRHGLSFRTQAKLELDILLKLSANPHLNQLVVKLLKVFDWQGHLVLVFELLSFNLYQLIKYTPHNGVTLDLVRKFAYQLVQALSQLEQMKPDPIIHCDIKPENILLKTQTRSAIRLIDFGSACYLRKVTHKYIQSRYYRSPEVILYLEYGTAIDRWSLGCVLVELHTGMPLFDGRTEAAQLALFEAMLGPLPVDMLEASPKVLKFYEKGKTGYKLREPPLPKRLLENVLGVTTGGPRGLRKGVSGHSEENYRQFYDFVSSLLRYRPTERMSCQDALRHPFLEPLWVADKQRQKQQSQKTTVTTKGS